MTQPTAGRDVAITLRFATLAYCPDGQSDVTCLRCQAPLDIHQPDAELPDRMLATCPLCRSWHLVHCAERPAPALIVLLPDAEMFPPPPGPGLTRPGFKSPRPSDRSLRRGPLPP